jgi:riboflavin kinase / FMN adenylyltransferase
MRVFTSVTHPQLAAACALTIGNFDGVHRGHQAMIALLTSEARHRGLPVCAMTFEPHPREYFNKATAPARLSNLRDKLAELKACGVDQAVVLPFNARLAAQPPQQFVSDVLLRGLGVRYVLVGDDFRFGAKRAGDYALLDAAGQAAGFDVARMQSYEVHGLRVSSSAVRNALSAGDLPLARELLGRPYAISGHVVHGAKLGRTLSFPTLNVRVPAHPALQGIFVVQVHGLSAKPLEAVASLGRRPTVEDAGRMLLEVHVFDWPLALQVNATGGYGKLISVEFLHKLHDERKYDGLDALKAAIAHDCDAARAWFKTDRSAAAIGIFGTTQRQISRDRI